MGEYKYAGLIYCECGSKFRSLNERGKNKYVCLNYAIKRSCQRNILVESDIDYLVEKHFPKSEVKKITVYSDKVIIQYQDGTQSLMSNDKIIF